MNQYPNMYNSQFSQGAHPSYPPQQSVPFGQYVSQPTGVFGQYPAQQPVPFGQYPAQQPVPFGQYSSQPTSVTGQYTTQFDDLNQKSTQAVDKQTPPYVDPNTAAGYDPNQVTFPPPPIVPRDQFPKDEGQAGAWGNFSGFNNKAIRRVFVRKVYCVLTLQLLVTFGIISIFHYTTSIRNYVKSPGGRWAYWSSYGVFLVTYLALACCKSVGRRFPVNLILLSLLTLSMAYMMGMISAYYTIESVFIAVAITSFVCLGVTLFSFQTKFDFTSCFGVLFAISLALMGFGIACIFTYSKILYTVYAGLGAVAFSIFLAVDTQLIIGGKRHEVNVEDHIFASIMLYLDVVYIFMYILMLVGKRE